MHSASVVYYFVRIHPGIEVWVHACSFADILIRPGTYLLWYNYHNTLIACIANEMAIHDYFIKALFVYIARKNPPTIRLVRTWVCCVALPCLFVCPCLLLSFFLLISHLKTCILLSNEQIGIDLQEQFSLK